MAIRLSDKFCENVAPIGERKEHADSLVPGLMLIVQPSGKKSWAVRYRDTARKPVKVTLGRYPLIPLADAREQAREVLQRVAKGDDVAAEKRVRKAITFEAAPSRERDLWWNVVESYLEREGRALRSGDSVEAILARRTKDAWASKTIGDVTRRDVVAVLDSIVKEGHPIAANRTLAHIRRVFNWARARDLITVNPCDGVERPAEETSRDRILTDAELRLVWQAATALAYPFGPMVRMLILTGQRLREVGEAEWAEFNPGEALWTVPPARAKNDAKHEVPLSGPVLALLAELPRIAPETYLFTTTGETPVSGFSRAKERIDAAVRQLNGGTDLPAWTFHDLRRTVASGMAARGVLFEVIERVLNHKGASRGGLAGIYNRHSYLAEKRAALNTWADAVAEIVR